MNEIRPNEVHIDYLLGKLPEAQRDALERELEQDPDLLAELQKVEATEDSMLQWLRDSFPAARYQNDPHLQALMENLENSVAELASGKGEAGPVRTTSPVEPLTHETRAVHGSQDDTSQDGHSGHLAPPPLKRLGRYRIESTIGQGGMGAVYLAHDEKLDRPVAMKIPFMGVQADQQVLERFMQEARSAASLHHRNICPIHDVGEIDGQPYLTMAFISGKTLATWVDQPHSASEIITVISKVARALHQAHQQGVIHRDLKPANIMIDDEGEPVVMDFGLARRESDNDQPQLTQAGQIMGTPAYMPPEQIAGHTEEMGPPCDIYALGVILYELLTGKRPFDGNLMQLMSQIALESPPALRTINDQIDPQLESIVLKSLEKQPGDRWDSMLAFAEALEAWQPKSTPSKEPPAIWRRWPLIAAGLLGIIGLVWAAVILLKVETSEGTIVLEIDQPELAGAVVSVDGQKKITIETGEGKEPIEITADEKTHTLKVTKGGFETFTKQFSVKAGKQETIRVRLEATPDSPTSPTHATQIGEAPKYDPSPPPNLGTWEPFGTADVNRMFPGRKIVGAKTLPGLVFTPAKIEGIKRWNVTTHWPHDEIIAIAYSPDGKLFALGSSDGTRIYDAEKLTIQKILPSTNWPLQSISWRPDGERLMVNGTCWSVDGKLEANNHLPSGLTPDVSVYSPDGTLVVSGRGRDKQIVLHDLDSGKFKTITSESAFAGPPAWSPDSERFATVHRSREIRIWSRLGELQATVDGLDAFSVEDKVAYIQWSPDGKWIGLADGIQGVVHRIGADGKRGEPIKVGGYPVYRFSWSADGKRVHPHAAVSPEGTRMISMISGTKSLTFSERDVTTHRTGQADFPFAGLAWNPNGDSFITGKSRGFDRWSSTGAYLETLEKSFWVNQRIAYQPGGDLVALCGPAVDEVLLGNAQKGFKRIVAGGYRSLSWSADGRYLAAARYTEVLEIYDSTGVKTAEIHGAEDSRLAGYFAPDKLLLVVWDITHGTLQLCSPTTDWKLRPIEGLEKDCGHPYWSPDGQFLYVNKVGVLKSEMDGSFTKISTSLSDLSSGPENIFSSWTPNGKEFLWAYGTNLRKYQVADGRLLKSFYYDVDNCSALSHHPTRNLFTTCHTNSTIITWNGQTMEPYWQTVMLPGEKAITFTAAGQILHGDRAVVDEHLAYYYETDDGKIKTVTPSEFEKLIGESLFAPAAN